MTNVYGTPEKKPQRDRLFDAAVEALSKAGWTVDRIPRAGKASIRRISKGAEQKIVAIRTTQDRWIAFPRTKDDQSWLTLSDVDYVVASSVDDRDNPQSALVHLLPAEDVRQRFDRAYAARKGAGHSIPVGRGVWVSLYDKESTNPVNLIGAGAGLAHPPIAKIPLSAPVAGSHQEESVEESNKTPVGTDQRSAIAEAKRWLANSLGVSEADIKITITC